MAAEFVQHIPTRKRLRRVAGSPRGLIDFIELGLPALQITAWDDDFQGDTLNGTYQSTASGANSAAAAIETGIVNGAILLDPGDANSGRCDLSIGLHYQGQLNAVVAARFTHLSAVGSAKVEIGFTDTVSGTDAGAVNAKATPTWTADDAAVLVYDTTDDNQYTLAGVAATVASGVKDSSFTPVAGTYNTFIVALLGGNARGYILDADGNVIYDSDWLTSAVTSTVLLTPWLFVQNRSGARRSVRLDRFAAWQRKTTA